MSERHRLINLVYRLMCHTNMPVEIQDEVMYKVMTWNDTDKLTVNQIADKLDRLAATYHYDIRMKS